MSNLFLWPTILSTQHQTRSSLCICVSSFKQVNPPWHLLSESPNKNTTEEESVKPVALTYLTVVSQTVRAREVSVCLFPPSRRLLSALLLRSPSPFRVLQVDSRLRSSEKTADERNTGRTKWRFNLTRNQIS